MQLHEPIACVSRWSMCGAWWPAKLDIVDVKTQAEADAFPTLGALIDAAING